MRVQLLVARAMTRAEGGLALPRRSDRAGQYSSAVSRLHTQAKSRAAAALCGTSSERLCIPRNQKQMFALDSVFLFTPLD
ncbi:hypothetical protein SRHO_G00184910 [Serrasalmus rhombeus]